MVNTFYDSYRILYKVYGEKAYIKQAINSEIIEPLNKNTVIKICYGVLDKDIFLDYCISKLCDKKPKLPIRILLKISFYCITFLNKAPYAVTDNVVTLCKKLGKGGMSGFLNAIIRKYIKNPYPDLPTETTSYLSIKYSFPEFAVKRLISDYGIDKTIKILEYDETYTFLRFNNNVNGTEYLDNINKKYESTVFDNTFRLKNFVREEGFYEGKYTFQSIGSIAICNCIQKGNILLDCCAAPGGKSVALSHKFNRVISCELHSHRAKLIEDYIARMKVDNITVKVMDSTKYHEDFFEYFDAILCDAPCSGLGVTKDNPDIKLNRDENSIAELNSLQFSILNNVSKYLKVGGCLYYSTCSILQNENDGVINKFLEFNKNYKVEIITSPLDHVKTKFGLQFLPDISYGAGFYICKLQKL